MIRDSFTCQKCGCKRHLQVHHKRYIKGKKPWEIEDKYLITLCRECHQKEHDIRPIKSFSYKPKAKPNKPKTNPLKGLNKKDKALQKRYDELKSKGKLK